jgi:hypothetical protein
MSDFAWSAWATVAAELAIAFVIYFEIGANRLSDFLKEIQSKDFHTERAKIYNEYAMMPGATMRERAEAFSRKLWQCSELRELCDFHLAMIGRMRHSVPVFRRYVFYRRMAHVVVQFWIMTACYIHERKERGSSPFTPRSIKTVRKSIKKLRRRGVRSLTFWSRDGLPRVKITEGELADMLVDPNAPFR